MSINFYCYCMDRSVAMIPSAVIFFALRFVHLAPKHVLGFVTKCLFFIGLMCSYPDAAEEDVRRYERSYKKLSPAHKVSAVVMMNAEKFVTLWFFIVQGNVENLSLLLVIAGVNTALSPKVQ